MNILKMLVIIILINSVILYVIITEKYKIVTKHFESTVKSEPAPAPCRTIELEFMKGENTSVNVTGQLDL